MGRLVRGPLPEKYNGQVSASSRVIMADVVDGAPEIFAVLAPAGGKALSAFTNIYNAAFSLLHFCDVNSPLVFGEAAATATAAAGAATASTTGRRRGRPPKGGWPVDPPPAPTVPGEPAAMPEGDPPADETGPTTAQEIHDARESGEGIVDNGASAEEGAEGTAGFAGGMPGTDLPPSFPAAGDTAPGAGLSPSVLAEIDAAADGASAPAAAPATPARRGGRRSPDAAPAMPG